MAFNPGDRVKWRYSEPSADPSELVGTVEELVIQYKVIFDDGSEEIVEADDIEAEDE